MKMRPANLREQLFSLLGLHLVGFLLLAVALVVFATRLALDWRTVSAGNQDIIAGRQAEARAMQAQMKPLEGMDQRLDKSRHQIESFYTQRIPPSYSAILEEIGRLQAAGPVRLTRAQYTQSPGSGDLTEIRVDAGLSGEYPAILRFINGLERSKTFFVIRAMALTGQQSGMVNLRVQFSTWLRPADADAAGIPLDPGAAPAPASASPATGPNASHREGE